MRFVNFCLSGVSCKTSKKTRWILTRKSAGPVYEEAIQSKKGAGFIKRKEPRHERNRSRESGLDFEMNYIFFFQVKSARRSQTSSAKSSDKIRKGSARSRLRRSNSYSMKGTDQGKDKSGPRKEKEGPGKGSL